MPTPEAGDCYFTAKGRDALVGFLHYLAVACDDNSSRAPRKPKPSIRGLADWMAAIMRPPETDIARRLRGLASIVRPANDNPNSSQHAFVQFATLAAMAEKERSGVLGTVSRALAPFKGDRPPARS
jgi:type IV secretory pathway TraG/TraD family ATPase VirD4